MHKHYLVVAHRAPDQVHRLVRRLDDGDSTVWLHVDAKTPLDAFGPVIGLPNVHLVEPRLDCVWGGFSQVETTLACLRAARAGGRPGYLILLSGQDYPIKSAAAINDYLDRSADLVHIDTGPIEQTWPDQFHEKVDFYCLPLTSQRGDLALLKPLFQMTPRGAFGWSRRLIRTFGWRDGLRHIGHIRSRRFSPVPQQFGGSSWWGMPWEVAGAMLDWLAAHPDFTDYYRYSQCPDEMYFHTAVRQLPDPPPERENLVYVDWSYGDWERPKTLGEDDLDTLLGQPEHKLFARKLDLSLAPGLFEALDRAGSAERQ